MKASNSNSNGTGMVVAYASARAALAGLSSDERGQVLRALIGGTEPKIEWVFVDRSAADAGSEVYAEESDETPRKVARVHHEKIAKAEATSEETDEASEDVIDDSPEPRNDSSIKAGRKTDFFVRLVDWFDDLGIGAEVTTSDIAEFGKSSQPGASQRIKKLVERGVLEPAQGRGRYRIRALPTV